MDGGKKQRAKYGVIFSLMDLLVRRVWRDQVAIFEKNVGYRPRIALPKNYHEKMLWRKIFDANPQFTVFLDKLAAKEFFKSRLPGRFFHSVQAWLQSILTIICRSGRPGAC